MRFEIGSGVYRVVDERNRPPVLVAWDATYVPVSAFGLEGAFFRSSEPGTVHASFVGRLDGGPLQIEGLSINDCPAEFEATKDGVRLRYGTSPVSLSLRPLELHSARFSIPRFADRVELWPLGLAFGRSEAGSTAVHCESGFGGTELRLERVPAGDYELVFTGEGQSERKAVRVPADKKEPKRKRKAALGAVPE